MKEEGRQVLQEKECLIKIKNEKITNLEELKGEMESEMVDLEELINIKNARIAKMVKILATERLINENLRKRIDNIISNYQTKNQNQLQNIRKLVDSQNQQIDEKNKLQTKLNQIYRGQRGKEKINKRRKNNYEREISTLKRKINVLENELNLSEIRAISIQERAEVSTQTELKETRNYGTQAFSVSEQVSVAATQTDFENELKKSQKLVANLRSLIKDLREQKRRRITKIRVIYQTSKSIIKTLNSHNNLLNQKDSEIANLTKTLEVSQGNLQGAQNQINDLKQQLITANNKNANLENRLTALRNTPNPQVNRNTQQSANQILQELINKSGLRTESGNSTFDDVVDAIKKLLEQSGHRATPSTQPPTPPTKFQERERERTRPRPTTKPSEPANHQESLDSQDFPTL